MNLSRSCCSGGTFLSTFACNYNTETPCMSRVFFSQNGFITSRFNVYELLGVRQDRTSQSSLLLHTQVRSKRAFCVIFETMRGDPGSSMRFFVPSCCQGPKISGLKSGISSILQVFGVTGKNIRDDPPEKSALVALWPCVIVLVKVFSEL